MPNFCMVVNCGSNSERDNFSFFRIPSEFDSHKQINQLKSERRKAWINSLKRADLTESKIKCGRICSKHFLSGKPANLDDRNNPDWIPSVNMGYQSSILSKESSKDRYERVKKRKILNEEKEINLLNESQVGLENFVNDPETQVEDIVDQQKQEIEKLRQEILERDKKNYDLQKLVDKLQFNISSFENNDNFTLYYTGFPEFKYVKCIYDVIENYLPDSSVISKFAQLILTLMKLRLNIPFKDLGFRFHIHHTTAARTFYRTIDVLYNRLKTCIVWPDRQQLIENIPRCFQEHFGKRITVIIDCFEVFTERPSNLDAAAKMWSNYKHHHTVKFLIGITPQGVICFVSNAYGGRASDKFITEHSGFLDRLQPGDLVVADRGFLISDSVKMCFAELVTPAFSKGRKQLSAKEIESTRKTANVRIHVERVIGMLRQKYTILKDTLPLQILRETSTDDIIIDKIVVVCCAFINLSPSIIPLD